MGDAATSDAAAMRGLPWARGEGGTERWADWYIREWVGGKGKGAP